MCQATTREYDDEWRMAFAQALCNVYNVSNPYEFDERGRLRKKKIRKKKTNGDDNEECECINCRTFGGTCVGNKL